MYNNLRVCINALFGTLAMPQWPSTPACRRAAARYLCETGQMNPYVDVLRSFDLKAPHRTESANGLIRLGDLTLPASVVAKSAPHPPTVSAEDLAHLALHCLMWFSIGNGTNWIRAQHLAKPTALTSVLWAHVSYMHAWPYSIELAASCARPDIQSWCRAAYYGWLEACRQPAAIERAMVEAMNRTWNVSAPSDVFRAVVKLFAQLQIASVASAPARAPDIAVNSAGGVYVARRDKALLSLMAFCGSCKALSSIPAIAEARRLHPEAFRQLPEGKPWMDELRLH